MKKRFKAMRLAVFLIVVFGFTGCTKISNAINPYYKTPPKEAYYGVKNDHALTGGGDSKETAALSAIKTEAGAYRGAASPKPYKPVVQPAIIRLMWVPDRLNRNGDLIPAHYYYVKILNDRFVIEDAFEVQAELNATTSKSGSIPFVYK